MADVQSQSPTASWNVAGDADHADQQDCTSYALPSLNDILSFSDVDVERDFGSLLSIINPDVPALQRTNSEASSSSDSEPEPATPESQSLPTYADAGKVPVEPALTTITITDVTPKPAPSASYPAMNPLASSGDPLQGIFDAAMPIPGMPQHVNFAPYAPAFASPYLPYHNFAAMHPLNHLFPPDLPFFDPRMAPALMHENAFMQAQLEMQTYALGQMMAVLGSSQQPRKRETGRVPRARTNSKRHVPYAPRRKVSSALESSASDPDESDGEPLVTGWRVPSVLLPAPLHK